MLFRSGAEELESRVRIAYSDWCKQFEKAYDETRFLQFAKNYLELEEIAKETGKAMVLNEYADFTEDEFNAKGAAVAATEEKTKKKTATPPPSPPAEEQVEAAIKAEEEARKKAAEEEAKKRAAEVEARKEVRKKERQH